MNNHDINKALADVIDLHVTEDTDGDRPIWLIEGRVEWNPVQKIEQLWPLVKRFVDSIFRHCEEWSVMASADNDDPLSGAADEPTPEHAIALAIINAHDPSRAGR